jgi:PAS domain S-box-containing protein
VIDNIHIAYYNGRTNRLCSGGAEIYEWGGDEESGLDGSVCEYADVLDEIARQSVVDGVILKRDISLGKDFGDVRYHRLFSIPEMDEQGSVTGAFLIDCDVTGWRTAEKRVSQLTKISLEHSRHSAVLLFDVDNTGVVLNAQSTDSSLQIILNAFVIGRKMGQLLPPDAANTYLGALDEADVEGSCAGRKVYMQFPDGERCYELFVAKKNSSLNSVACFSVLVRDVTKPDYSAAGALRDHDEVSNVLVDNAPDPVMRYDNGGECVYANHSATSMLQIDDLNSDSISEPCMADSGDDRRVLSVWQVLKTGESNECETSHISAEGKLHVYQNRFIPLFGGGEDVTGVLSVSRDVSAFKETLDSLHENESALAMRERELRTLTENSPDCIVRFDTQGRFVYVNRVFEKWTGVSRNRALGRVPLQIVGLSIGELLHNAVLESVKTGCRDEFEHVLELPSGEEIWCHVNVIPEYDKEGKLVYVQLSARDVSMLKNAEHGIRESREQLRKLSTRRELENEFSRKHVAWEIYDKLGQHLMMLRMKLSAINLAIDMSDKKSVMDMLSDMLSLTDSSIAVVRSVSHELCPVTLDLGIEIPLDWLADKYTNQAGMECVSHVAIPPDFKMCKMAAIEIFRVAEQAVNNAAVHSKARHLTIRLVPLRDSFLLEISDDGIGFDLDAQWGNGLGLLDMRERAHRLKGELVVLSQIGGGTVVEMLVPAEMLAEGGFEDGRNQLKSVYAS